MDSNRIEQQLEAADERINSADNGQYAIGDLILAIGHLIAVNHGLLARIEQIERATAPMIKPQPARTAANYIDGYDV